MSILTEDIKQKTIKDWVIAHSDTLYTWALSKTSSIEIAEDLVQETFLAATVSYDKFQNKSNPKTWLFSILNNKIIDHYRKKANTPNSLDQITELQANQFTNSLFDENGKWNPSEMNSIWDDEKHLLDDVDFNEIMKFCMGDLPEKWRIAISSKYLLERTAEEICQELEVSTTNYWQVIHRAKLLLKKCIEKHWRQ